MTRPPARAGGRIFAASHFRHFPHQPDNCCIIVQATNSGGSNSIENHIKLFTLRTEKTLSDKLTYIAEYNLRFKNREIEQLIKRHIAEFEKTHGKIDV